MKKKVLLIAALFTAGLSFAQDGLTSKKGVPILPEAGDWSIGFDASSLLNYGGNMLNGNTDNSFAPMGDVNANTVYGKKFIDANTAYRAMLRLGFGSNTNTTYVKDLSDGADADATVENDTTMSSFNITIGGGKEFRRGKGRLQGVYGPMASVSFGTSKQVHEFGNDLSSNNAAERITEAKNGSTFGLALGGFAGVEYFFAPKISLGAEIGWNIQLSNTGDGEVTTEKWTTASESNTVESAGNSSFSFDTRPNANITLNFHF